MPIAIITTYTHTPTAVFASQLAQRWDASWPWYLTRASGIIAAILLFLLIISGVGLITGYTFRYLEPVPAWSAHRAISIAFTVSAAIHVLSLLFDKYVGFSFLQLFIPFLSKYTPATLFGVHMGSLWVAMGIVSIYCIAAIMFTSLFWIDKKPGKWRLTHYLTYGVVALTFFHALGLGTDVKYGLGRKLWIAGGLLILVAIVSRLRLTHVKRNKTRRPPANPQSGNRPGSDWHQR